MAKDALSNEPSYVLIHQRRKVLENSNLLLGTASRFHFALFNGVDLFLTLGFYCYMLH
jgi:hypothetical protein